MKCLIKHIFIYYLRWVCFVLSKLILIENFMNDFWLRETWARHNSCELLCLRWCWFDRRSHRHTPVKNGKTSIGMMDADASAAHSHDPFHAHNIFHFTLRLFLDRLLEYIWQNKNLPAAFCLSDHPFFLFSINLFILIGFLISYDKIWIFFVSLRRELWTALDTFSSGLHKNLSHAQSLHSHLTLSHVLEVSPRAQTNSAIHCVAGKSLSTQSECTIR